MNFVSCQHETSDNTCHPFAPSKPSQKVHWISSRSKKFSIRKWPKVILIFDSELSLSLNMIVSVRFFGFEIFIKMQPTITASKNVAIKHWITSNRIALIRIQFKKLTSNTSKLSHNSIQPIGSIRVNGTLKLSCVVFDSFGTVLRYRTSSEPNCRFCFDEK